MSIKKTPQELLIDKRRITMFREVAHTTGPLGPNISENHWSLYLILEPQQGSVRINMTAEKGYIDGILEVTVQAYTESNSRVAHWDYPANKEVRVKDIIDKIYKHGRHLYTMSGGGSGCRWWQYVILSDIENEDWVARGTAAQFYQELLFRYHKTTPKISLHMVKGTFESEESNEAGTVNSNTTTVSRHGMTTQGQSYTGQGQGFNSSALFPRGEATTRHQDVSASIGASSPPAMSSQKRRLQDNGYKQVMSARASQVKEWVSRDLDGEKCYINADKKLWIAAKNVKKG